MQTTSSDSSAQTIDPNVIGDEGSTLRQKLGSVRRRIKQIDLREKIIEYPFAAVGIGLAAGALVAIIRPKPQPGRVTSALVTVAGALAFRLIREAAVAQLGGFARDYLKNNFAGHDDEAVSGSDPKYAPPF